MTRTELAIWTAPGQPPQRGIVVKRGKSASAAVVVDWDNGQTEKVKPGSPGIFFAFDGSQKLQWILHPDLLSRRIKEDPTSVIVDMIKEHGGSITGTTIKKQLAALGIGSATAETAFEKVKTKLKQNRHIVAKGPSFSWSDVEVDPYEHLRTKAPSAALDYLLNTPRLKLDEKQALADAIRAGFTRSS